MTYLILKIIELLAEMMDSIDFQYSDINFDIPFSEYYYAVDYFEKIGYFFPIKQMFNMIIFLFLFNIVTSVIGWNFKTWRAIRPF